jgi:hypothetical protein
MSKRTARTLPTQLDHSAEGHEGMPKEGSA